MYKTRFSVKLSHTTFCEKKHLEAVSHGPVRVCLYSWVLAWWLMKSGPLEQATCKNMITNPLRKENGPLLLFNN